jgi:hypothetical protein
LRATTLEVEAEKEKEEAEAEAAREVLEVLWM